MAVMPANSIRLRLFFAVCLTGLLMVIPSILVVPAPEVLGQTTQCIQPPSGLVSWWPGDGNANDIRDGNNGLLQNGATFAAGQVGQAFSFDGVDDFVSAGSGANLDITSDITMDAWVKPTDATKANTIVSKGDFFVPVANSLTYNLQLLPVSGKLKVQCGTRDTDPRGNGVASAPIIDANTLHHVACTISYSTGGVAKIYVDGVEVASAVITGSPPSKPTEPLFIGALLAGGSVLTFPATFAGLIDEVEIYNRALSASEIQAIFNVGSTGKCKVPPPPPVCVAPPTQMVSWWPGDGNANDIQDNNQPSSFTATFTPGKVGQAFLFDATTDGIVIPDSFNLRPQHLTLDAWVKPKGPPTGPCCNDQIGSFIVEKSNVENKMSYAMGYSPLTGKFWANTSQTTLNCQGPLGCVSDYLFSASSFALNNYYHVAVTYDGATVKLYVNGQLEASKASTVPFSYSAAPVVLIGSPNHRSFNGEIDEVEIYNKALTTTDVQAIFNAGSAGKCKPFCGDGIITPQIGEMCDSSNLAAGQSCSSLGFGTGTLACSSTCKSFVVSGCSQQCTTPATGMVSWWPGDGNANDIIDENPGMRQGGVTFAPGMVGQAFSFDGTTNADIVIPHNGNLNLTALTIDAWIKAGSDIAPFRPILVKENDTTGAVAPRNYWFGLCATGQNFCAPGQLWFSGRSSISEDFWIFRGGPALNDNNFHHVAVTYANNNAKFYIDGNPVLTTIAPPPRAVPTTPQFTSSPAHIGRHAITLNPPGFLGIIDELEIFNRALSASEIQAIFSAGSAGKCKVPPNRPPVANSQSVTTAEDTAVSFNLTGSDPDNNPLTFHIVSDPSNGVVTGGTAAARTYTPNVNFFGLNTFTFKVNDGSLDSNVATVSITVTPVNDAPTANAGPDQTVDSTSPAGAPVTLNGSGSDVDGDTLVFTWTGPFGTVMGVSPTVTVPVGTHTITLTVRDPSNATGTDTVVVIVRSPTEMISRLINLVQSFNLRQGIENSLDAKLQAVQATLTASRDGDRPTACNQIQAFINEAQAQSGKALMVDQANQLIAAGNQIRAALGCS